MPNFFIAFRYLSGKNQGGGRYLWGAVAGIALSLVPVIVTLIVADGMIRGITDRFVELGTGHLQVWEYLDVATDIDQDTDLDAADALAADSVWDSETLRAALAAPPEVRGVWRQREGMGVIIGGEGKTGVSIRAVEPSFWQDEGSSRYLSTIDGDARLEADNDVSLGEELARITGARVGKTIRIMTVRQSEGGLSVPRTTLFTVKGIISSGYYELDSMWCIISYAAGLRILSAPAGGDPFVIKINDPYKKLGTVAAQYNRELPVAYWVYKWTDILRSQYSSYEQTRQLLLFIMLLIVLVAAVNVSSATSMLVIERQRDIAIFKAFGAQVKDVRAVFLWCSFLTGFAGSVLGISCGLIIGACINQVLHGIEAILNFVAGAQSGWAIHLLDPSYYLQTIPIIIDVKTVVLIAFFTITCSCVSGFFPARKAGRSKPVELLRKY